MPSKRSRSSRRRMMLFPLMDMFFILLLFFLVTSGVSPEPPGGSEATYYATPEIEMGQAQILLQMIDRDSLVWLDNACFDGDWRTDFRRKNSITVYDLGRRLEQFMGSIGQCTPKILIGIRCPGSLDYGDILRVEQWLLKKSKTDPDHELHFSLLEGSIDEITVSAINPVMRDSVVIVF